MMAFAFGFSGEDFESQPKVDPPQPLSSVAAAADGGPIEGAFPVAGKAQLPPRRHSISQLCSQLPSKLAYALLSVTLDDGSTIHLPRRELWDVKVQLMAEDETGLQADMVLGAHDVKAGLYEGGFKSWESSLDLVKVMAAENLYTSSLSEQRPVRIIELGCGTGLPSLAFFQSTLENDTSRAGQEPIRPPLSFILGDYNPTVLELVTLPNFLLAWAIYHRNVLPELQGAFSLEGELELTPEILQSFQSHLQEHLIDLSFISGGWSSRLVDLIYETPQAVSEGSNLPPMTIVLGAETIYSPFALQAFTDTLFAIMKREKNCPESRAIAFVAAKRLYFGVGGSLDDFVTNARSRGAVVTKLREETDGVRRGVVRCLV